MCCKGRTLTPGCHQDRALGQTCDPRRPPASYRARLHEVWADMTCQGSTTPTEHSLVQPDVGFAYLAKVVLVDLEVSLGAGAATARAYGCDLTKGYIESCSIPR